MGTCWCTQFCFRFFEISLSTLYCIFVRDLLEPGARPLPSLELFRWLTVFVPVNTRLVWTGLRTKQPSPLQDGASVVILPSSPEKSGVNPEAAWSSETQTKSNQISFIHTEEAEKDTTWCRWQVLFSPHLPCVCLCVFLSCYSRRLLPFIC